MRNPEEQAKVNNYRRIILIALRGGPKTHTQLVHRVGIDQGFPAHFRRVDRITQSLRKAGWIRTTRIAGISVWVLA